jgi:hypothetical protein
MLGISPFSLASAGAVALEAIRLKLAEAAAIPLSLLFFTDYLPLINGPSNN